MATDTRNKPQRGYAPAVRLGLIRQMQDEVDRWFHRLGVDSSWISPAAWLSGSGKMGEWSPAVDAFQRGNEFVIRADVPGMTRTDLNVEVTDDAVAIGG